MDLLAGITSDLTGKIAKATIRIKDDREMSDSMLKRKDAITNASGKLGMVGSAMADIKDSAEALNNLAEKSGFKAAFSQKLGMSKEAVLGKNSRFNKVFEVQFNPSTFSISAYGGGYETITDASAKGGGIRYDKLDTYMQLSVRLIFDRTDETGAFPISTLRGNDATTIGNVIGMGKAIKSMVSGPAVSVETVVEGFIGAVRGAKTKHVCFDWGKMSYEGILKSVNANYTLFDAIGQPTRAEVDFSIYLYDEDVRKMGEGYEMGYWKDAYQNVFNKNSTFGTLGQTAANKVLGY